MGLVSWIKETWRKMFLRKEADEVFGIELPTSKMDALIQQWYDITSENPPWLDEEDDVKTINFAQFIDEVTAGLVTLDIGIHLPDSPRGKYLQGIADYLLQKMDEKVSEALGNAGIMFKPNGENVDYFYPGTFLPTDWDSNGNINGCMFIRRRYIKKKIYTKFEYHRYENLDGEKVYAISNKAFKSESANSKGKPCSLSEVPEWEMLEPEMIGFNIEIPLFAYYGNPKPNFIDRDSPLKLPIWGNCTEELKDLDIAWSRKGTEVEDSKHMTIVPEQAITYARQHNVKLPRFIRGLQISAGTIEDGKVNEHVATLLTEQRIKDINSILAMISTKLGYDQGFFVLDEKTGVITATQVESDDQSTIRTIKNLRDPLQNCLIKVLYGASKFADFYTDIPAEGWANSYEEMKVALSEAFSFGDITYSYEEDKAAWWKYRIQGDVPSWMYYMKFEGMSEDEAKAMVQEAQPKETRLFAEE